MVLEVMYIWRLTLANTNLAPQFNYTGNSLVSQDDLIFTLQNDMKSYWVNYNKSQNTLYMAIVKSAAYALGTSDNVIFVDTTSSALTMTLPTSIGNRGKVFTIKDWAGNAAVKTITIATTLSQTIDGAASKTITTNYGMRQVVSDNANWFIIGSI